MPDTGWLLPGSAETGNGSTGGADDWANIANIKAKDGSNATVTIGGDALAYDIRAYNFGAAVPGTATIAGIEARVKWAAASGTLFQDALVSLCEPAANVAVATGVFVDRDFNDDNSKTVSIGAAQAEYTAGGAADDWSGRHDIAGDSNRAWLPADVNDADFSVVILGVVSINNASLAMDSIELRVHYTGAAGGRIMGGLAGTGGLAGPGGIAGPGGGLAG